MKSSSGILWLVIGKANEDILVVDSLYVGILYPPYVCPLSF